jgi:hypothetical protein
MDREAVRHNPVHWIREAENVKERIGRVEKWMEWGASLSGEIVIQLDLTPSDSKHSRCKHDSLSLEPVRCLVIPFQYDERI